jgi:hypothetical protein
MTFNSGQGEKRRIQLSDPDPATRLNDRPRRCLEDVMRDDQGGLGACPWDDIAESRPYRESETRVRHRLYISKGYRSGVPLRGTYAAYFCSVILRLAQHGSGGLRAAIGLSTGPVARCPPRVQ